MMLSEYYFMEENSLKTRLRSLMKKWRHSETLWERSEKFWQKKACQWLLKDTPAQEEERLWRKADFKWHKSEERYQTRRTTWTAMEMMLYDPSESVLKYNDLLEFESKYENRKKHWDNRKTQWLQKQAFFTGREQLLRKFTPCTVNVQTQTDEVQLEEQEEYWKNLAEELKQKLVNCEEQLKTAQDQWHKWLYKEIHWLETEERLKINEELLKELQKKEMDLEQENVSLNEKYLELLKEKQSELDDTKLKRTEEENTDQWTVLTREHEQTVSALKQEQEDHRATKVYWQDRLRQMESESKPTETVTEARGGLVEEENWKNLAEELKQKLVNCEEQLKTAKDQWSKWHNKEINWMEMEEHFKNNEELLKKTQADLQQEVHLRHVFQEAYEKRERIVLKHQETWEQEKKQLQKKETDLEQENASLNEKYLELLEETLFQVDETKLKRTKEENQYQWTPLTQEHEQTVSALKQEQEDHRATKLYWLERLRQMESESKVKTAKDQLSEWFQKERHLIEKEEHFKNNELLKETQTKLLRESHLRNVFQEACEKRERTFLKRQETWEQEKKQLKKKETALQQENVSLKLELLKEKQSEVDDGKQKWTEEENQERWTALTQEYEEVLSALKQEQSKCRGIKLYWQERVQQMESESRLTKTVTEARGGLVEPKNEVLKDRDNPGPETNDKKKKKVRWWRFWKRA